MKIKHYSTKNIYIHLAVWLSLLSYVSFSYTVDGNWISKMLYPPLYILNFVLCYYLLVHAVFTRFYEHKKVKFFLTYLSTIIFFLIFDYAHVKLILPTLGGHRPIADLPVSDFIKNSLLNFSLITFTSTSAYLNSKAIDRLNEIVEFEKRVLSRELFILSDQFNSHLTFNFMNFCYSHLIRVSSKAAHSFESFTQMLQYSLDNKDDKYVPLETEIEYIENFIAVQKCLSQNVFVNFHYKGNMSETFVLKGIFSILLENAFKHGISDDINSPIDISLDLENSQISFSIKNKKEIGNISVSSGIGLKNLNQVLNIFYPDSYILDIQNNEQYFFSKITLKVK